MASIKFNTNLSKTAIIFAIVFAVVSAPLSHAFAQAPPPPPPTAPPAAGTETKGGSGGGPRKHLATIIFAGLGGAILGLSTLSFYGRPQEKLNNIAIGFAFGVIGGTALVTYKAATQPEEFYGQRFVPEGEVKSLARAEMIQLRDPKVLTFGHTFEF